MKIVIIHGQSHTGSTCKIARMLAEQLHGETTEFFVPRDFDEFCCGCTACIVKSETNCPHYQKLKPITDAMDEADVIVLASPVYVYHVTGSMKALLDHYGYRWMAHRPDERMFRKQAVCVTTAAGAGMKTTLRDMTDSAFYWGCAHIYRLGMAVAATSWDGVSDQKKRQIERKTAAIAGKISKRCGHVRPGLKTKLFFGVMRMLQKNGWNPADKTYWHEKGWIGKKRPW
ncbi:MAG: NAD(P)H-dependent oxidoreductase [Oscillospiraceae bacterium]|nr:NAD(P)H-dependent oxidoreductase [Oscillospiraceae bacterium]